MTGAKVHGTTTSTRRVHHGRVIDVAVDTVRFPDGTTGEMDIVRHPGACAVLPFLTDPAGDDPMLLLIRQYRHVVGEWLIEIPAGRLERGEKPAVCAHRELREETGYAAARLDLLTTIVTTPGFSDERIHLFSASELTQGPAYRDADEFIELMPLTLTRTLESITSGEITDGKTVVAVLLAKHGRIPR